MEKKTGFLGFNGFGEEVYGTASGGRRLEKDQTVLGELMSVTTFDPLNPLSDIRYKTTFEAIETLCHNNQGGGLENIGANAALLAMLPYWKEHLAEGHSPDILITDVNSVCSRLRELVKDLSEGFRLPSPTTR